MSKSKVVDFLVLTETEDASTVETDPKNFREIHNSDNTRQVECDIALQTCGVRNRNGRIYTPRTVNAMYTGESVRERLKGHKLFGEMQHPATTGKPMADVQRMNMIVGERTCFILNDIDYSLENSDNMVYGKFKTLSSPLGEIVRANIVNNGTQYSVSSRTLMTSKGMKKRGKDTIIDTNSCKYITHDLVDIPSDRNAQTFANDHYGISKNNVYVGESEQFCLKLNDSEVAVTKDEFKSIMEGADKHNNNQMDYFVESFDLLNEMTPGNITKGTIEAHDNGLVTLGFYEDSGVLSVKQAVIDADALQKFYLTV